MAPSINLTLDALISGPDGQTIDSDTMDRLGAYALQAADGGECKAAAVAFAVRRHGVNGGDGAKAVVTLAGVVKRDRSTVAGWATVYGWLLASATGINAANFREVRRAYNSTPDAREMVERRLSEIGAAPEKERAGIWHAIANECATAKKDAQAAAKAAKAAKDKDGAPEEDGAKEDTASVTVVQATWLQRLIGVTDQAPAQMARLDRAERAHVSSLLAILQDALKDADGAAKARPVSKATRG